MKKILTAIALALGITLSVTACASGPTYEVTNQTMIIDVRTPEEFATGHLDGAVNIDIQAADFRERVMELDPSGEYFIYCRSGNRSGQAISQMSQMGFTTMTNGGSVQEASTVTGITVVTD